MSKSRTFLVWRGDQEGGEFKEYKEDVESGMVVLGMLLRIQARQATDRGMRWNWPRHWHSGLN